MLAETLSKAYSERQSEKIHVKLKAGGGSGSPESYEARSEAGVIRITSGSELGLAYGAAQLGMALRAGHVGEWTGLQSARFPLRPLSLGAGLVWKVNGELGIPIPHAFEPDKVQEVGLPQRARQVARRAIEMGYNSILFSAPSSQSVQEVEELDYSMDELCQALQVAGLQVLFQPMVVAVGESMGACPLKPKTRAYIAMLVEDLLKAVPKANGIFWESLLGESSYSSEEVARDFLIYDLVLSELRLMEHLTGKDRRLVFYLPSQNLEESRKQAQWISDLCDDADTSTIIAFSSTVGHPVAWEQGLHPFWQELRRLPDSSYTPLMPVVNVGNVKRGNGLWPNVPLRFLDEVCGRLWRHRFAGVTAMTDFLPKPGGFNEMALWALGQAQWRSLPPTQLAETWLLARRPAWSIRRVLDTVQACEYSTQELYSMLALAEQGLGKDKDLDLCRSRIEALLAQLKYLQILVKDSPVDASQQSTLDDYVIFYLRDTKRMVHHCLKKMNIAMGSVLVGDDLQEAFWTEMDAEPSRGIGAGAEVNFLARPNRGEPDSRLRLVADENLFL